MGDPELNQTTPSAAASAPRAWVATTAELDAAASLLAGFRDWFGHEVPSDAEMRASVAKVAAAGDGEYLLAAAEGGPPEAVLQLRYRWSVWKSADDAWIEDVFVRESARGQGLGRALVELAIERARERGCKRIELDVDEDNAPARALYRDLGFADDAKAPHRSLLLGRAID
jgi:GNAT superfamily N-acetyltransferase